MKFSIWVPFRLLGFPFCFCCAFCTFWHSWIYIRSWNSAISFCIKSLSFIHISSLSALASLLCIQAVIAYSENCILRHVRLSKFWFLSMCLPRGAKQTNKRMLFTEYTMSDSCINFCYSNHWGHSKELYLFLPLSWALAVCPFLLAICLSRVYLFGLFEQELRSPVDGSLEGYLGSVQTCHSSDYLYNLFVYILLHCISKTHLNAIQPLVPNQFFLIHIFPKAPIPSFLCSDLLLLPNHSYKAEKNNNKNFKILITSTSGLTYEVYGKLPNNELTHL